MKYQWKAINKNTFKYPNSLCMKQNTFIWLDKWPYTFSNWAPNEPSFNEGENCTVLLQSEWKDTRCDLKYPAICEYNTGRIYLLSTFLLPFNIIESLPCKDIYLVYYKMNRDTAYHPSSWTVPAGYLKVRGILLLCRPQCQDRLV